ncbi:MAG TPA: thrombospondin type 3 repeat-containing protein [Sandaracinaceae bacterium]
MRLDISARAVRAGALAALAALVPSPVHAQSVLTPDGRCIQTTPCVSPIDCEPGSTCTSLERGAQRCLPDAPFCCLNDSDCRYVASSVTASCTVVPGLAGSGLCLTGETYCGMTGVDSVLACHTTPGGVTTRDWRQGDCDGDGTSNGDEVAASTDPCAPAAPVAIFDGESCHRLAGCRPEVPCETRAGEGTCTPTADGLYCAPDEDVLYCCTEPFACPDAGDACVDVGPAHVCVRFLCAGTDPIACVKDDEGHVVPFDEGDCDRDGESNGDEIEAGTDPCTPPIGPPDAGAVRRDGGAGTRRDGGGTSEDAGASGAPPDARFHGGGGCTCRVRPPRERAPGFAAFLALALVLLARRR